MLTGGWAAGLSEGEGVLRGVGGALCDGSWHRGEMVGPGRRVYESGEVYEGEFVRGLRHGRGMLRDEAKGVTYAGWHMGVARGRRMGRISPSQRLPLSSCSQRS